MEFTCGKTFGPGQTGYLPFEDEYLSLLLLERALGGTCFGDAWEDEDDYGYYGDDEYE